MGAQIKTTIHTSIFLAETMSNLPLVPDHTVVVCLPIKRDDPPMAGDTRQILQRHLLHPLVAQALEGWQLVLGAERRFTREV
jgi:hypothetical protein